MHINFLLPGRGNRFSGGYKVIYKYANGLARLGHKINLVHTPFCEPGSGITPQLRSRLSYWAGRLDPEHWQPSTWCEFDENVNLSWVPEVADQFVPNADATVVSFWHSAEYAQTLNARKGIKFYLIQEYEFYMTAAQKMRTRMEANFRSGYRNLAISPAVAEMLDNCAAPLTALVPNGIELDLFWRNVPILSPQRQAVGFPYRPESFKGTDLAIQALEKIREQHDQLAIWCYGSVRAPALPEWIHYRFKPTDTELRALYNTTRVFLTASDFEGWGLPGSEAMACGAALVSTDSGGVRAYATNDVSALICPTGDSECLGRKVMQLLTSNKDLERIAGQGWESIQEFTWDRAIQRLESIFAGAY